MGFFLFPLYLMGAAALGVPLWVHLRNRQSSPPYRFSTLRFLIESSILSERRKQFLRWLVLLLRLGALAALALAFAQPWLRAAVIPGSKAVVLVIDISASMQASGVWPEAKKAALACLDEQTPGTRVAIVTLGRSAKSLTSFADPVDQQRSALDSLSPAFESTDADAAVRFAARLLEQQSVSVKQLTVISDFTTAGWRSVDYDQPLPPGVAIDIRAVAPEAPANLAVTAVHTPRTLWSTATPIDIVATIHNFSLATKRFNASCTSDAGNPPPREITLVAGASQDVSFSITPAHVVTLRGSVQIDAGDALPCDDQRFFSIPARKPLRVTHWAAKSDEADLFLQTALEPSADAATNRYRWVAPNPVAADPASAEPLSKSIDVLLLDQGSPLAATQSDQLQQFITDGGRIIVFLGDADQLTDAEKRWLPITLGPKHAGDGSGGPAHPALLNFIHPILEPFSRPHGGDLFRVSVARWRQFSCAAGTPLISLADGSPLLAVLSQGKGRVAVFALPMRRDWSDWPIQPTFLPLMHETLKWLEGDVPAEAGPLVGDVGPDGKQTVKPGLLGDVAVNLDAHESDLSRWTMLDRFKQLENPDRNLPEAPAAMMTTDDAGRRITWMLLMGVAIFSLCELVLANRTPR